MASTLTRPREGAVIAGVCAGLAERFGWSPFAVRLVFLLSCLLPGPQFIIYLVLWVIMPAAPVLGATRAVDHAFRRARSPSSVSVASGVSGWNGPPRTSR